MDAISALVMRSKPMSGRRLIAWGLPIALAGGALIIVLFAKYGRGNFTRAARIVEAHGARIALRSSVGTGSTFSFRLRFAPEYATETCSVDRSRGHGG